MQRLEEREREHTKVRIVARRVTLPLHGEQSLDKERDFRGTKSDTHALNSGPTQVQPRRGVSQPLTIGGHYLPFVGAECPYQVQISLFPKMVTSLARTKDPLFQPTFPFLCLQLFHMQGLDLAISALLHALAGVLYISPPTINGVWWLKSLTVTSYQTSMLKKLYLMTFKTRHVAFAGVSSYFDVASFPALGRQTLLFINVMSLHLALVGD